jgi:endonuclease/exonuclease/phosphatase family metal-dependent hydrolase
MERKKLHDVWNYPSDHLALGVSISKISGTTLPYDSTSITKSTNYTEWIKSFEKRSRLDPLTVVQWNTLNKAYMKWIEKNDQGLYGSGITKTHGKYTSNMKLIDQREVLILIYLSNISQKADILCLQEVSTDLLTTLRDVAEQKKTGFRFLATSDPKNKKNHQVIMFSPNVILEKEYIADFDTENRERIQAAVFKQKTSTERFIVYNTHVPWNMFDVLVKKIGNFQETLQKGYPGINLSIVCGDFNISMEDMTRSDAGKTLIENYKFRHAVIQDSHVTGQTLPPSEKVTQFDYIMISNSKVSPGWITTEVIDPHFLGTVEVIEILKDAKAGLIEICASPQ